MDPLSLRNRPKSKWVTKDWERAGSPNFQPGFRVTLVPVRHPENDDTWTVGIYDPIAGRSGQVCGHILRGCLLNVKSKSWPSINKVCKLFVAPLHESVRLRKRLTKAEKKFLLTNVRPNWQALFAQDKAARLGPLQVK